MAKQPLRNRAYWGPKLSRNVQRDGENAKNLKKSGWTVGVIWECETKNADTLASRIADIMGRPA